MKGLQRQRGVALIMAVLIVALAVILATQIGFDSTLEQRRSETVLSMDQAFQVALGAEAWAASYLKKDSDDANTKKSDHAGEEWATPIPPIPVDGGEIQGQIEDLQGRFNLNSLIDKDGTRDELSVLEFRKLLSLLKLEQKWADIVVDWIDKDSQGAAEDDLYSMLVPPYRPPNRPIVSISELLSLPGFGRENYLKLAPYVTALPLETPLNLCTASGYVLDAMTATVANPEGQVSSSLDLKALEKNRSGKCFPQLEQDFGPPLAMDKKTFDEFKKRFSETSSYFRLTAQVTIGTTEFTLYSLLHRDRATGQVRPILRSFGTD